MSGYPFSIPVNQASMPGVDCVPVTPSDSAVFDPCRAFWIGGAGTLVFRAHSGEQRTVPVSAGLFPVGGDMVLVASTATDIFRIV